MRIPSKFRDPLIAASEIYMLIFAARQESDTPCGHLKNFKILLNHFGRGLRKNAQDEFASSRIPQH